MSVEMYIWLLISLVIAILFLAAFIYVVMLRKLAVENKKYFGEFAYQWYLKDKNGRKEEYVGMRFFTLGTTIFYLGYVLAAKTDDLDKINDYLQLIGFEKDTYLTKELAEIYENIVSNKT